jgi:hypothetical protein
MRSVAKHNSKSQQQKQKREFQYYILSKSSITKGRAIILHFNKVLTTFKFLSSDVKLERLKSSKTKQTYKIEILSLNSVHDLRSSLHDDDRYVS